MPANKDCLPCVCEKDTPTHNAGQKGAEMQDTYSRAEGRLAYPVAWSLTGRSPAVQSALQEPEPSAGSQVPRM